MRILSQPFDNRSSRGFFMCISCCIPYLHNIVHTLEFLRVFSFYDVREVETGKNNKRFTVKTRDYIGRKRTTTGYGPASICI